MTRDGQMWVGILAKWKKEKAEKIGDKKEPGWFPRFEAAVIRINPDLQGLVHYTDILYYYRHYQTLEIAAKEFVRRVKKGLKHG